MIKNRIKITNVGIWLAVGAVFQDTVLPGLPQLSLAKLMFAVSIPILLATVSISKPSQLEIAIFGYAFSLLFVSFLLSSGGISERTPAVAMALVTGLLFVIAFARSKADIEGISSAIYFWIAASFLLAVIQSTTGIGFVGGRQFQSNLIPDFYRASAFLNDPNYFSFMCLISMSFTFLRHGRIDKIFRFIAFLCLVLAGSRAGLIGGALLFLAYRTGGVFSIGRTSIFLFLSISILGLAFSFRHLLPSELAALFDVASYSYEEGANSLSFRMLAIVAGVEAFLDNPAFGYGLGNLTSHPSNTFGMLSHNTAVELLAETGIVGGVCFGLMAAQVAIVGIKLKRLGHRAESLLISNLIIITVFMSMTLVLHYSRIFFFLLACVAIISRSYFCSKASRRQDT